MKTVWIYSIEYYHIDDEYGHPVFHASDVWAFNSKESAEKWQRDWESIKNLKSLVDDCKYNDWYYGGSYGGFYDYSSEVKEIEIMDY